MTKCYHNIVLLDKFQMNVLAGVICNIITDENTNSLFILVFE